MKKDLQYYESLILENPISLSWYNSECGFKDGIYENPKFVEGLSIEDRVAATVLAYNKINKCISYRRLMKITDLSRKEIKTIIDKLRSLHLVEWVTTFSEDTGLLAGKGLFFTPLY